MVGGNNSSSAFVDFAPRPNPQNFMPKAVIKSYASGVTTTDAVISEIVPVTGRLVGMQVCIRGIVASAASENVLFEFSTQSTSQFTVTSASGIIAYAGAGTTVATAGSTSVVSLNLSGFDLPVQSGSRLYVHRQNVVPFSSCVIDVVWIIG